MTDTACYIHIPFCDHKCIYCDFYSIITADNVNNYLEALKKEISFHAEKHSQGRIIRTIYFGGGTPSYMEPEYLAGIINQIKQNFTVSGDAEITMETNPGTVSLSKLKEFRRTGINRISIGIQSFHEDELKFLTRIHDNETAVQTVRNAADAGFENISLDLIFNLPGQSKEKWLSNLEQAIELPIKHISAYSLILERGTILNKMVLDGKVELQDEEFDAELYELTISFLKQHGFVQYEVSNFCFPGYESIHNNYYWRYKEYFGFGTSAHSFLNKERSKNYSALNFYISAVKEKGHAIASTEFLSENEITEEYTMLALRSAGLDLHELKNFDAQWAERNKGYLKLLEKESFITLHNNFVKFTPKGYAVCDEIISKFD